jgi:hypothetical protein
MLIVMDLAGREYVEARFKEHYVRYMATNDALAKIDAKAEPEHKACDGGRNVRQFATSGPIRAASASLVCPLNRGTARLFLPEPAR